MKNAFKVPMFTFTLKSKTASGDVTTETVDNYNSQ